MESVNLFLLFPSFAW